MRLKELNGMFKSWRSPKYSKIAEIMHSPLDLMFHNSFKPAKFSRKTFTDIVRKFSMQSMSEGKNPHHANKLANLQDADEQIIQTDMRDRLPKSVERVINIFICLEGWLSFLSLRQQTAQIWPTNYFNLCFFFASFAESILP